MTRLLLLIAVMILLGGGASAAPSLTVSPRFGHAPLTTRVKLTIPPSPTNRIACLIWDGPTYGSSCWEVGSSSPKTTWKLIKDLEEGYYQISVEVEKVGGKREVARASVCSIGPSIPLETCVGGGDDD